MKQILIILLLLTSVSCEQIVAPVSKKEIPKYRIVTDDGNFNGILSRRTHYAISYEIIGERGIKFITSDGKEHFTTYSVKITEQ